MAARKPLAWSHTAISWNFLGTAAAAALARVNFGNACDPTSVRDRQGQVDPKSSLATQTSLNGEFPVQERLS